MQNSIDPAFADHLQCCFYHSNKHPAEQWGVQQPQRWKQLSHKISSSEYFFYDTVTTSRHQCHWKALSSQIDMLELK
jgi:hypothetical protein